MKEAVLNSTRINEILKNTLDVINNSRKEIFEIAENARNECDLLKQKLLRLQEKARSIIDEVDHLEVEEKKSRKKLLIVSKNFHRYNEEDIKHAYEEANNVRINLSLKRQEEQILIQNRRDLELRLKNAMELVTRAEKLVGQTGVAMDFLSGNLNSIIETLEDMNKRQLLGIKIIQAQEEERQRVAREIHDGPAQLMANVVLKAEICERLMAIDLNKTKEELKNLKDIVRNSLKDVRRIIYDLRPMSLDDLGLIPTVQRYASKFMEDTGIHVEALVYGQQRGMDSINEIAVFRIIQEALSNIRKHAKARKVRIKMESTENNINVIIDDDGIGFDSDSVFENHDRMENGFGLIGMRERAELLGGKVKISSEAGSGTKIFVNIPINRKEELDER